MEQGHRAARDVEAVHWLRPHCGLKMAGQGDLASSLKLFYDVVEKTQDATLRYPVVGLEQDARLNHRVPSVVKLKDGISLSHLFSPVVLICLIL